MRQVFLDEPQVMISIIGCKWELFVIDSTGLNPYNLLEHHGEVCIVWHLLREKPRQEFVVSNHSPLPHL